MGKYIYFFFITKVALAEGGFLAKFQGNHFEFEVHPALIAFRFKNEQSPLWGKVTYLKGTISRLGGWHKTREIFTFLANYFQITEKNYLIEKPANLSNMGIYELSEAKLSRKLYCCWGQKNSEGYVLFIDFCFSPVKTEGYLDFMKSLLYEFAKNEIWPNKFQQDIVVFQNQENLSFTLPPLWLLRYQNEERAYFTDAAGFAELEIYQEKLKATELESAIIGLWEKSMLQKLAKNSQYRKISQAHAHCFVVENMEKQLNFCYTVRQNLRIVMLTSFPVKLYEAEALTAWQIAILEKWALG